MTNDVREIVHLLNYKSGPCHICRTEFAARHHEDEQLEVQVNHYLGHEGCRLLHVGQQTERNEDGGEWQITVAVIGLPTRTSG